jgi:diguanylate cyclase (GGDEF)-like protein
LTWQPAAIATLVTGALIYGFGNAKPSSAIVMWVYTLPPLYLLLFNRFIGTILSFLMLITTALIYFPNLFIHGSYPFAFVNFVIPYSMIWLIAFNHEAVSKQVQTRLETLAKTDALTGAYNRLALHNDADHGLHCCDISHLLHFDLDFFKAVNDSYGHSTGDLVLKAVVEQAMNVEQAKVYRLGGEEFCIIFCAPDIIDAKATADKFKKEIENLSVVSGNNQVSTTISGSLMALPLDCCSDTLDEALQKTDAALYKAKNNGKNQIILA